MKKISILLILAVCVFKLDAQLALSNFNSNGLGGWFLINDANNPDPGTWTATYITKWKNAAFVKIAVGTGDSALIAPAVFSPTAPPDRWLISPSFPVENNDNTFLLFDYLGNGGNATKSEEFEVLVSTAAALTKASFVSVKNLSVNSVGKVMAANIGSYKGQTIRVAIRYKSLNGYLAYIDNIRTRILNSKDAALSSVSPALNSITAYGLVGSNFNITGRMFNLGATSIPEYKVYYQEGNNPAVSKTITPFFPLSSYDYDDFSFDAPYSLASIGAKNIKVWIEYTGDTTRSNDTLKTKVTGVSYMPKKKILFEQATGTWCGWCPRGHVFMDSFGEKPERGTTIAVHNGDPMTITTYDNGVKTVPGFSGYPGMAVDRTTIVDPSVMFLEYEARKNNYGFADMKRSVPTINGSNISTKITIRPAADMSGDYRLVFVISENLVTGYTQTNYYSSSSQNRDLIYKGVNWKNLPNPVPAADMEFNHVARAIYPAFKGDATSALPTTMKAGEDYSVDISGAFSASWNKNNLHYNVILVDGTSGFALNSINDTGYLAPKASGGTGAYADTFHAKVFKVTTAAASLADVYSKVLTLPSGTNYTWIIKKSNIVIPNGWKLSTICDPRNCYDYTDDRTDTFNARPSSNKIYLGFDHAKTVGYGYAILNLWKTAEGESKSVAYKYSLLTSNSSSISLVSDVSDKLLYYFDKKIFVDREFSGLQLEVYDLNGKKVLNTKVNADNIDFSPLNNGIYIARISRDGEILKSHKFTTAK